MEKVNVAVVGAGIMGEIHAESYAQYEKSDLIWVCDVAQSVEQLRRRRINRLQTGLTRLSCLKCRHSDG